MKRQIRMGTFETNSSSTHSLAICTPQQLEEWKEGKLVLENSFDVTSLRAASELSEDEKEIARVCYEEEKTEFMKDWDELSEDAKNKYYLQYAKENDIFDEDSMTYDEFFEQGGDAYIDKKKTPKGEDIVIISRHYYC